MFSLRQLSVIKLWHLNLLSSSAVESADPGEPHNKCALVCIKPQAQQRPLFIYRPSVINEALCPSASLLPYTALCLIGSLTLFTRIQCLIHRQSGKPKDSMEPHHFQTEVTTMLVYVTTLEMT